jgi:dodecin
MAARTKTMKGNDDVHEHRTARVIELLGTSTAGFDEAVQNALTDANATLRGISGARIEGMSVKCRDGRITEYKVDLKVAFGVERTGRP